MSCYQLLLLLTTYYLLLSTRYSLLTTLTTRYRYMTLTRTSLTPTPTPNQVHDAIPHQPNAFELFGFDILIDAQLRPWLIEVSMEVGCSRK